MRSGGSAGLVIPERRRRELLYAPPSLSWRVFLRNERAIIKLAPFPLPHPPHLEYRFTFAPSKEREKRRERTLSFGVCVALEGGSDGSPGESSLGVPGSHRGK